MLEYLEQHLPASDDSSDADFRSGVDFMSTDTNDEDLPPSGSPQSPLDQPL
jgi:hypothetical protein